MERIRQGLQSNPELGPVHALGIVDSTNDEIRRRIPTEAVEGLTILAEGQRSGRGRRGRSWHSPSSAGLYLSVLLQPGGRPADWTRWTLAAGVALCEAGRELGAPTVLKWPNDLLVDNRKAGGILVETRGTEADSWMIVGAGMNLAHPNQTFPESIRDSAVRISPRGDRPREELAIAFLRRLIGYHESLKRDEWTAVRSAWEGLAPGARGHRVSVPLTATTSVPRRVPGRTMGLDSTGALRVQTDVGTDATELISIRSVESVEWLDPPGLQRKRNDE